MSRLETYNLTPLVSIVIPCYNYGRYLSEAIESALTQTHPHIEILVVDDGSVDDTKQVAAKFPSVYYHRQENAGLASARNRGLQISKGMFISFLDADDRLTSIAVARGLAAVRSRPQSAFVSGKYRLIDASGREVVGDLIPPPKHASYADLLRFNLVPVPGSVLFRREPLIEAGGFDGAYPGAEDYDMYLRLSRTYSFTLYDDFVVEYRQHTENMTRDIALIMKSTICVLEAQIVRVTDSVTLRQALSEGIKFYGATYGRAILRSATYKIISPSQWGQAVAEFLFVWRLAPHAFCSAFVVLCSRSLKCLYSIWFKCR